MNKPTIHDIITVMEKLNIQPFTQPFSVNLGGIRTRDNKANTFNDWLFSFYYDDKGKIVSVIVPGTTDAGLTYRLKPINKNGTAIIKHGMRHRGVYEYQNPPVNNPTLKKQKKPLELGHNGKEAFRQVKSMEYWRDNDKNPFLGESEFNPNFEEYPIEFSVAFTNGHDMGTLGKEVNNFSAGCWGSIEKNMDLLYEQAKMQIAKGLGKTFSFTLLHENDF